jgi:hypothetical protein
VPKVCFGSSLSLRAIGSPPGLRRLHGIDGNDARLRWSERGFLNRHFRSRMAAESRMVARSRMAAGTSRRRGDGSAYDSEDPSRYLMAAKIAKPSGIGTAPRPCGNRVKGYVTVARNQPSSSSSTWHRALLTYFLPRTLGSQNRPPPPSLTRSKNTEDESRFDPPFQPVCGRSRTGVAGLFTSAFPSGPWLGPWPRHHRPPTRVSQPRRAVPGPLRHPSASILPRPS